MAHVLPASGGIWAEVDALQSILPILMKVDAIPGLRAVWNLQNRWHHSVLGCGTSRQCRDNGTEKPQSVSLLPFYPVPDPNRDSNSGCDLDLTRGHCIIVLCRWWLLAAMGGY